MSVSHSCQGRAKCHVDTCRVWLKMSTSSSQDEYHRIYFEAIDLAVSSIKSRFDFKIFLSLEQLLLKACSGKSFDDDLKNSV